MPDLDAKLEAHHLERLRVLLRQQNAKSLEGLFSGLHPLDAARLSAGLNEPERLELFRLLAHKTAADIVERMSGTEQVRLVNRLEPALASDILNRMDSDDAVDVLQDLPRRKSDEILAAMPGAQASRTRALLAYPENSAASIMATEFVALPESLSVAQALKQLRARYARLGDERATYVYTVDPEGKLAGVLQLRHLVTRPPRERLRDIQRREVVSVPAATSKYEVARMFRRHQFLALPVVEETGKLVGVITADDVITLVREITSEEILKLQGVSGDESRTQPVLTLVGRRVKWLSINIVLNLIAASVIAMFTDTLQAVIALAVFLPIISDMSGCSGMQAVAVSIRDLALGQAAPADIWKVLWKEIRVGFVNGLILGAEIGLVAWLWKGLPMLGVVVAATLWLNTIIALCLGGSLPLVLKRLRLDPAIASGPILTTVTDLMGFLIVLSLAQTFIAYLR